MSIQTINPATEKIIQTYPEMSQKTVSHLIALTDKAQKAWQEISFSERAKYMKITAELLNKNKEEYARLITQEMGKPITAARSEIEKCAWVCTYYAEHAEELLAPRDIKTELKKSRVLYQPLGVIFAIMPWNFPFWQVFRFAAPNLMAGNGCLLSHAPITTGAGQAIEKLLEEAGFPKHLFHSVIVSNDLAAQIIRDPLVRGVTLTGSERAGKIVGAEAAGALKKVVLELGGNDPYVVLEDADLQLAAEACLRSRMNNSGQVCIAAKRLIVVDQRCDELEQIIKDKLSYYTFGDPMEENTVLGPMARADLRDTVHQQVQQSLHQGAVLVEGGYLPKKTGFYYPPTFLKEVKKGMPAYEEEIFGPVVSLIRVKNELEAIRIANDSRYGLAAAVFTQDIERGFNLAATKIQAGTCYVNGYVSSDPRLPFGGIKSSGYGRELSAEGIREFCNVKTVCIKQ